MSLPKNTLFLSARLVLFSFLIPLLTHAQDLPKVIHPSPETSALFRFQDYPMDYSTGLPQISIPICEVKSGSLSVPISISYHAAGRRVSDQNGPIALGWSLNAGGTVARTVYGSVDFGTLGASYPFPFPLKVDNVTLPNDLAYLERVSHFDKNPDLALQGQWLDSEYDIFSYSCNGNGGKFIFKDNNGVKTPILLPYKPYRITPILASGLTGIEIVDDAGITYVFMAAETYSSLSASVTSAFALKYIISADKKDTISFSYSYFYEERRNVSQQYIFNDLNNVNQGQYNLTALDFVQNESPDIYQVARLTEIQFRNGKVLLNLVNGTSKYDNIEVRDLNNQTLRKITFNRSLFEQVGEVVVHSIDKLDGLTFKDGIGNTVENYGFQYYPSVFVENHTTINVRHQDWWGYHNASGVHDMVPYYTNLERQELGTTPPYFDQSIGNPNYNREPNLEARKSGVLKKITYPTGGTSEFIYENNKYLGFVSTQVKDGPGLRILQIKTDDNNGNVSYKTYKYGVAESGYGVIDLEPQLSTMSSFQLYGFYPTTTDGRTGHYRQRIFYSGFNPELGAIAERPITYAEVTEYQGTESVNLGKTIYKYDTHNSWTPAGLPSISNTHPRLHIYEFNYLNTPQIFSKEEYVRSESGGIISYHKRREQTNTFAMSVTEYIYGLHVQKNHIYSQGDRTMFVGAYSKYPEEEAVMRSDYAIYSPGKYRIPAGYKNLISTVEALYNDDGSIISNEYVNEYNSYQLVKKTTKTASDGIPLIKEIKYPFDNPGDPVLSQMVGLNMLNIPVEQHELKNTTPIKSVRTNYFNWGITNPMLAPKSVEAKQGNTAYEARVQYHGYDENGNVLSVSKEKDVKQSYIWGYNKTYPIAQIINAEIQDVFHTSFEEGDGNSATGDSRTGKKSKTNGFAKSLTGLTNGSYDLSYWTKSGGVWTLQKASVSVTGGFYSINLSGQVDEVRFYPTTAQMTTFTFEPLIGMLSQSDINNRISYYEYDAFGRLKLIRDMDNNIIKTFKYKYQSTTP